MPEDTVDSFVQQLLESVACEQQGPHTQDEAATDQQHSLSDKAPQQQQQQQQPLTWLFGALQWSLRFKDDTVGDSSRRRTDCALLFEVTCSIILAPAAGSADVLPLLAVALPHAAAGSAPKQPCSALGHTVTAVQVPLLIFQLAFCDRLIAQLSSIFNASIL